MKPVRFTIDRVHYAISGPSPDSRKAFILELEDTFRSGNWPWDWYEEQIDLWKKLIVDEALAYLTVVLEEHGFPAKHGEKTLQGFYALFEDFSLGQVYSFIWRSAKDAASIYLREKLPKNHAANIAISNIRKAGESAIANGWDVKPYRRDHRCPEPSVYHVFFNTILKIGADGFSSVPYNAIIPDINASNDSSDISF